MKMKNISLGDSVQVKKSMCHSEFKANQVCEVIDIDLTDKHGFDVLIQGKNCLDWVNHKDLKKPQPQLKQLDQSVFNGLDEKWRFAAVDKNGEVWLSTHKTQPSVSGTHLSPEPKADSKHIKGAYDSSNWQNSLIERDIAKELLEVDLSSELTGSDLCKAMLEKQQAVIPCWVNHVSDEYAVKNKHLVFIRTMNGSRFAEQDGSTWPYAVPLMVEPLTQSDVGL